MRCISLLFFLSLYFLAGCYKESDYDASKRGIDHVFTLSSAYDSIPADGVSRTKLYIKGLPDDVTDSDNSILLETDHGSFDGSTTAGKITISSSMVYDPVANTTVRQATATLISAGQPDSAHLAATMKGSTQYKTVYFYRAWPNRISIVPSILYTKASLTSAISIEVSLLRDTGTVSLNTPISFTATDTAGHTLPHDVGAFQLFSNRSNAAGKCNFTYFFTDTAYLGAVQLKATTLSPSGKPAADSINLIIYK